MRRYSSLLVVCSMLAVTFSGGALFGQGYSYPRLMTPGGRYYGPTVAADVYQREYGQPWHGLGGLESPVSPQNYNIYLYPTFGAYGWYGNYGYGCAHGSYGGYVPPWYVGNYYTPPVWLPPDFSGGVSELSTFEAGNAPARSNFALALPAPYTPQFTSEELQAATLRRLSHGDLWLKKLDYENACQSYAAAESMSPDAALPHFRLGMVLTALGRYPDAVAQIKKGLAIDSAWPANGEPLDQLFGPANALEKSDIKHRVADWVQRDIRDPDRLFLMGVLLHFDRHNQAGVFFETAMKLAGKGAHLEAFLRPPAPGGVSAPDFGFAAAAPPRLDNGIPAPPKPASPQEKNLGNAPFVPPLPVPENRVPQPAAGEKPAEGTAPKLAAPKLPAPKLPTQKPAEPPKDDSGPTLLPPNP